ncbi:MAG: hypothetical protein GXO50_01375 [Chlorobi bacterium]|nr:hypothetical protein [Chlorobiota bacterium]
METIPIAEEKLRKYYRLELIIGFFLLGSFMMWGSFLLIEPSECDKNDILRILCHGLSMVFIYSFFQTAYFFYQGDKIYEKESYKLHKENPNNNFFLQFTIIIILLAGIITAYFRALFHLKKSIDAGLCNAGNYASIIWKGAYPVLGITLLLVFLWRITVYLIKKFRG